MHAWPKKVSTMETDELAGLWTRLEGASRLWWLVVLTTIAGCVAGFGYGYRAHPEVTAQASVVFRPASTAERFIDSLSSTAMATEKELASDPEVYARVVEITGTDNATISDKLTADVPLDSNVLILTATAADEDSAVELGNAYADAFLDFRSSLNSSDTEAVAERTGPARVPNPGHNVGLTKSSVFGGLLGLVIGLAAALVLASRDNRLRGRRSLREVMRTIAQRPAISLLFTDVVLGDSNGRLLAERVRTVYPGLPVLFTTGYTRNAIVHQGRLDPDVNLLNKPFTQQELARKIRELLDTAAA